MRTADPNRCAMQQENGETKTTDLGRNAVAAVDGGAGGAGGGGDTNRDATAPTLSMMSSISSANYSSGRAPSMHSQFLSQVNGGNLVTVPREQATTGAPLSLSSTPATRDATGQLSHSAAAAAASSSPSSSSARQRAANNRPIRRIVDSNHQHRGDIDGHGWRESNASGFPPSQPSHNEYDMTHQDQNQNDDLKLDKPSGSNNDFAMVAAAASNHQNDNVRPLSRDMIQLSIEPEPAEPMDGPMVATDAHDMSQRQMDYSPPPSQRHQIQQRAPHQQRSTRLPEPRAGKLTKNQIIVARQAQEPTSPPGRLGRRCLTEQRPPRRPDRFTGVLVVGGDGDSHSVPTTATTTTTPGPLSIIKIECIDCQRALHVPKYAIVVDCPNCQSINPVASCRVLG